MPLFKRREPEPLDLWGPNFNPRRVPMHPDPVELDRLVLRAQTLAEIRAPFDQLGRAMDIVANIEAEIAYTLDSPTKHRDWREARLRVMDLLTQLGEVVYQEVPAEA
jgi:hypothetical protein